MNNAASRCRDLQLLLNTPTATLRNSVSQTATVYSPVTDLAMSFGDLITDGFGDTPKRRLSLDSTTDGTPTVTPNVTTHPKRQPLRSLTLNTQLSVDDGCYLESPSPIDSDPYFNKRSFDLHKDDESALEFKSEAFRRFKSLPKPFADLDNSPIKSSPSETSLSFRSLLSRERTPERSNRSLFSPSHDHSPLKLTSPRHKSTFSLHDDEESSQDSGVGLDKAHSPFAKPLGPAPRRHRMLSDDTNSPKHLSPKLRRSSTPDFTQHFKRNLMSSESPVKLRQSSLTFTPETDDGDDGFLELLDSEDHGIPKGMEGLLSKPLIQTGSTGKSIRSLQSDFTPGLRHDNQENIRPKNIGSRRGLFRSPSTPNILGGQQMSPVCQVTTRHKNKRSDDDENTPVVKRRKSVADFPTPEKMVKHTIQRCHSSSEAMIKTALDTQDTEDVIGDFSKPYCLPSIRGKHTDLKCISPETMSRLLRGEFDDCVETFKTIDCRFPYEFEGGHIQDALNIWERDAMMTYLKDSENRKPTNAPSKRKVIIFHCEFSSERGPKMSRFLRKMDRANNKECYPSLDYPELYLLEGGYKAFYHQHVALCEPQTYKPMSHQDHLGDLRHFRAKSKSWAGEKAPKGSRIGFRQLKL